MNGSTPPSWLPNISIAVEEAGDKTVVSSGLIGLLTGNSLCPLPTPSDMILLLAPGAHAKSTLLVVPSGCYTTTFDPFSLSTLEGPCGGFSPTTPPPFSCSKPLQSDPSISTVNCHFPWCRCLRGHQLVKRQFTDANYQNIPDKLPTNCNDPQAAGHPIEWSQDSRGLYCKQEVNL